MKKLIYLMVIGIMCATLVGCGKEEKKEPEKIETVEDLQEVIEDYQEQKEAEHQQQLEAEYPEGVLPAGTYKINQANLPKVNDKDYYTRKISSLYVQENGIKNVSSALASTQTNQGRDSYKYNAETGEYTFDLYLAKGDYMETIKGYYEDDKFIVTYYEYKDNSTVYENISWEYIRK